MIDWIQSFVKWWNRKWSNWELDMKDCQVFQKEGDKIPIKSYDRYKRTSDDGIVEYKRIYQ